MCRISRVWDWHVLWDVRKHFRIHISARSYGDDSVVLFFAFEQGGSRSHHAAWLQDDAQVGGDEGCCTQGFGVRHDKPGARVLLQDWECQSAGAGREDRVAD